MAEYIDREAAIDTITGEHPDAHYPQWYADMIKRIPTVDVVPVVRCRDCKYLMFSDCYGECRYLGIVKPDDFCSHGKRKDDNNAPHT